MKKSILLSGGIALVLGFASCDDGSAKITELQGQLDAAQKQNQVTLDSLNLANQATLEGLTATYQVQVDSLQWIIDSLTAPKGTKPKPKPAPKPTATTPTTEAPKNDGKLNVTGTDGKKLDVKGTTDTTSGKTGTKLKVKP